LNEFSSRLISESLNQFLKDSEGSVNFPNFIFRRFIYSEAPAAPGQAGPGQPAGLASARPLSR
jgi:hypothetical protein